ncbi:hypothetical protein [Flagellimonas halotolerans]|uniref:Uncharacterized protein n=1 Tax=Flagellimonas halotolerans TaxID=3112164 RepID=A0ABU6INJ9_9FLAO|nr:MULTISPECIES: hypothetical protein [unclassified Allomuricauda]MEC3964946.1 hypothetical protein [Muricauda sp. SYSU M86414]MEC4264690.1 hypothetical protein [Muricauda sp. SYSU M84420]
MPELTGYISDDFILNKESAPYFQVLLDYIYPIAEWKPDKREFFSKMANGICYVMPTSAPNKVLKLQLIPKGKPPISAIR